MSIYTQTHGPLSYHYVNNDVSAIEKFKAKERMEEMESFVDLFRSIDNPLYNFDGKHYTLRAVK